MKSTNVPKPTRNTTQTKPSTITHPSTPTHSVNSPALPEVRLVEPFSPQASPAKRSSNNAFASPFDEVKDQPQIQKRKKTQSRQKRSRKFVMSRCRTTPQKPSSYQEMNSLQTLYKSYSIRRNPKDTYLSMG